MEQLPELVEELIASLAQLEQGQRKRKAFLDRHRQEVDKAFEIGKPLLVLQTRLESMSGSFGFGGRHILVCRHFQWHIPTRHTD